MAPVESPTLATQSLPYGDLAIALYASDMPLSPDMDDETVLDYAHQGVQALGGFDRVRRLHEHHLRLNRDRMRRCITDEAYAEAISALWPDTDRFERCIGYDIWRLLQH